MKIVLNKCYGGFGLSKKAYDELGLPWDRYGFKYGDMDIETRTNPNLVRVVEELGEDANGRSANLVVFDVEDRNDYYITEYDGIETLHYGGIVA